MRLLPFRVDLLTREGATASASLRMEIGDAVIYRGRHCVLRGLDPMSVDDRRAQLEDAETRERFWVALNEVENGEPPQLEPVA
jgi:hypothetical protein